MKTAVTRAQAEEEEPEQRRGDAPRPSAVALLEQLAEHRHERAGEGGVRDEDADQVRDLERDRERVDRAPRAEVVARDHLADQPEDARDPRRDGEDRRRPRQTPARAPLLHAASIRGRLLRSCRPLSGPFHAMANIKQQKKRVRIAARQRLENLRYRSTIKTLTKRLEKRCAGGRQDRRRRASRARALDRPRRLPRRTAPQRRRAQEVAGGAAGLRQALLGRLDRAAARHVDERSLQLEIARQSRAALERVVELGEANRRVA